jgi:LPS export ABC transporter permease LptG/LPS export ABC transporter permease LptF
LLLLAPLSYDSLIISELHDTVALMRRIDKLLFIAITPPFIITFIVLTFIVMVHEFGTLSELLISRNASFIVVLQLIGAILPDILVFSLPLSFLVGILIGLGGLSGESQILALRACGISLNSILRFILQFGLLIGITTAVLSLVVLPRTNELRRKIVSNISLSVATSKIQARVFNEDYSNYVFYLNDLDENKQRWSGLFLADYSDPKTPNILIAKSAIWLSDQHKKRIQLHLEQGASYPNNIEDPRKDRESSFGSTEIPIILKQNAFQESDQRPKKLKELKTSELWRYRRSANPEDNVKQIVELNRRIVLPLTFIPFSLLGIALAIGTPKSGRTLGFGLGLVTVIVFYMLFANGIRLSTVGKINPWLGPWISDLVLTVIGLFLLIKVEKKFALTHWSFLFPLRGRWNAISWRLHLDRLKKRITAWDNAFLRFLGGIITELIPKVLDFHILRGFITYFFWSLISCSTLFLLLTIFELLDDIIRNRIPIFFLLEYLIFLTPQIFLVAIPMSILLAVLINLGILEKDSEITALKASGCSLYRLAIPIFLIATVLSAGLFIMQDYLLPYANERQDSLRNYIQNKPPRSSKRLQRKWILGDAGRIYNYKYFDGNKDSFVDLNIFEVDFAGGRLLRRMHAAQAKIRPNGDWILENGWIRDYRSQGSGFENISSRTLRFPENAEYFKNETFQPKESSKFTYRDLNHYIHYLEESGYNAVELQVELNKKISFPLSCLVMAFLGVPFAFSFGKKGAFFGIGTSIAIAISYWGLSGSFEAMGSYGMLFPVIAAWAPNLLFGAAGLYFFLNVRT